MNGSSEIPRLTPLWLTLVEWGRLIGVGDPAPGTQAELYVNITVTTQGGTLPAGTQLLGASNVTYHNVGHEFKRVDCSAIVQAVSTRPAGVVSAPSETSLTVRS